MASFQGIGYWGEKEDKIQSTKNPGKRFPEKKYHHEFSNPIVLRFDRGLFLLVQELLPEGECSEIFFSYLFSHTSIHRAFIDFQSNHVCSATAGLDLCLRPSGSVLNHPRDYQKDQSPVQQVQIVDI